MAENEEEIDALSGVKKKMLSYELKHCFVDCFLQEFPKDDDGFEYDEPGIFQHLFPVLNDSYINGELQHIGSRVEETITPSYLGPYLNLKPDTDKMYVLAKSQILKEGSVFKIEYIKNSVYVKVLISPEECGSELCRSCVTLQDGKYLLSPRELKERASKLVNSALFGLTTVFHYLHDEHCKESGGQTGLEEAQFSVNTDITGPSIKLSYKGYNEGYRPAWTSVTYPEGLSEEESEAFYAEDHVSTQEADFVLAIQLTETYPVPIPWEKNSDHERTKINELKKDISPSSNSEEMCTDGAFLPNPVGYQEQRNVSDENHRGGGFQADALLQADMTDSGNLKGDLSYEVIYTIETNGNREMSQKSQIQQCKTNTTNINTALPLPAHLWVSRERKWPDRYIIKKVLEQDYFIVPKSSSLETQDIEWRLSFSKAEITLMTSLPRNSWCKHCYRIFKCLIKYHLDRPKVISTYHCKTIFFWTLELQPPDTWTDINLGEMFLLLLDRLIHSLVQRKLDHYFVPQYNLFHNIDTDFILDLAKRLSDIRLRPLDFIYRRDVVPWDSEFQGMTIEEMLNYDPNDYP